MNLEALIGPLLVAAIPTIVTIVAMRQNASKLNAETAQKWQEIANVERDHRSDCETARDAIEQELDAVKEELRCEKRYVKKLEAMLTVKDIPLPAKEK